MKELIYLACPYAHKFEEVRTARFLMANKAAAKLIKQGNKVFSPISHSHPLNLTGELPQIGWDFWEAFDRCFLEMCKALYVLKIDGWDKSVGVTAEIRIAKELGIPIHFVDEDGNEI